MAQFRDGRFGHGPIDDVAHDQYVQRCLTARLMTVAVKEEMKPNEMMLFAEVYPPDQQVEVAQKYCELVHDAIEALLALVGTDKTINEVYNVGGTGEITIKELAKTVIKETKSQSPIEYISYEKAYSPGFEDMQRRVPDVSKIKQELNWAPKKNLSQIIADVAAHITNS